MWSEAFSVLGVSAIFRQAPETIQFTGQLANNRNCTCQVREWEGVTVMYITAVISCSLKVLWMQCFKSCYGILTRCLWMLLWRIMKAQLPFIVPFPNIPKTCHPSHLATWILGTNIVKPHFQAPRRGSEHAGACRNGKSVNGGSRETAGAPEPIRKRSGSQTDTLSASLARVILLASRKPVTMNELTELASARKLVPFY